MFNTQTIIVHHTPKLLPINTITAHQTLKSPASLMSYTNEITVLSPEMTAQNTTDYLLDSSLSAPLLWEYKYNCKHLHRQTHTRRSRRKLFGLEKRHWPQDNLAGKKNTIKTQAKPEGKERRGNMQSKVGLLLLIRYVLGMLLSLFIWKSSFTPAFGCGRWEFGSWLTVLFL